MSTTVPAAPARGPLPLTVGVIGELTPAWLPQFEERFGGLLERLAVAHQPSTIVVVTSIENEAGRAAAGAALARGVRLAVPLGRPRTELASETQVLLQRIEQAPGNRVFGAESPAGAVQRYSRILVRIGDAPIEAARRGTVVVACREVSLPLGLDWDEGRLSRAVTPAQIDQFNTNALTVPADRAISEDYLFPQEELEALAPPAFRDTLAGIRASYAWADALALCFRDWQNTLYRWQAFWAFLALFFLQSAFFLESVPAYKIMRYVSGLFSLLAVAAVGELWRRGYRLEYVMTRAVAEGMRVRFFWRLAGIAGREPADQYRLEQDELQWVPLAPDVWSLLAEREAVPSARLDLARRFWVQGQVSYFADRVGRLALPILRATWGARALIGASFVWSGVFVGAPMLGLLPHVGEWLGERDVPPALLVLAVVVASVGGPLLFSLGAYMGWVSVSDLRERKTNYERMLHEFRRVEAALEGAAPEQRQLLLGLGDWAAEENANWLRRMRNNPTIP